jgi:hypothetical protein
MVRQASLVSIVRISSGDPASVAVKSAKRSPNDDTPPPATERIPDRYNQKSQVTFDVKTGRGNVFDIDIRTSGERIETESHS